jgi:hypothetical protein
VYERLDELWVADVGSDATCCGVSEPLIEAGDCFNPTCGGRRRPVVVGGVASLGRAVKGVVSRLAALGPDGPPPLTAQLRFAGRPGEVAAGAQPAAGSGRGSLWLSSAVPPILLDPLRSRAPHAGSAGAADCEPAAVVFVVGGDVADRVGALCCTGGGCGRVRDQARQGPAARSGAASRPEVAEEALDVRSGGRRAGAALVLGTISAAGMVTTVLGVGLARRPRVAAIRIRPYGWIGRLGRVAASAVDF